MTQTDRLPPHSSLPRLSRRVLLANLLTLALAAACSPLRREAAATGEPDATEPLATQAPGSPAATAAGAAPAPEPSPTVEGGLVQMPRACPPPALIQPTPAPYPGYTQIDASGLHVTAVPPDLDLAGYRLQVTGLVDHPLELSLDDIRCMPRVQGTPPLVCPGFFIDRSTYSGTPLAPIIAQAGPQASAGRVELTSADGYQSVVGLAEAQAEGNFLAYGWEGEALPILHGFPVRAVFPTQEGNKWVKWLVRIELR